MPSPNDNAIAVEYAASRDPKLKADIAVRYQWLSQICARRMQSRWEPLDDLIQVCNVGLLQALERFDPDHGVMFRTYAEATMRGVVRHHYRTTWRLHVPRRLQDLALTVSRLTDELAHELRRPPTVAEIAVRAGVDVAAVIEAFDVAANFWPMALSHDDDSDDGPVVLWRDEDVDARVDMLALLNRLPAKRREVLYLRYFEDRTRADVAVIVGCSQATVFRTERDAVDQLRRLAS